jgi:hypothetical protein
MHQRHVHGGKGLRLGLPRALDVSAGGASMKELYKHLRDAATLRRCYKERVQWRYTE